MKKHYDWEAIHRAQKALAMLYPGLFALLAPVPLQRGIKKAMRERFPDMPPMVLNGLLMWLTGRRDYLERCVEGSARYGFDGEDGVVTAKDAKFAAAKFAAREASSYPRKVAAE